MLRIGAALEAHHRARGDGSLLPLLPYLTANIAAIDSKATARLSYAVAVTILFLLLERSVIQSFSFLGIMFNNIENIKIFLPPVALYLAFSSASNQLSRRLQEEAAYYIISSEYDELSKSGLEGYLVQPHLIHTLALLTEEVEGVSRKVGDYMGLAVAVILVMSVPIFYVYAFFMLFRSFGFLDVYVWMSFVISTIVMLYFCVALWLFDKALSAETKIAEG